jgi:hypothetical protein
MASIRRVRRDFRKEVFQLISSGDGSIQKLVEAAGRHFGHFVGYEVLIKTFLHSEVGNAVSCLRTEGQVETVGKQWKSIASLQSEDVEIISLRRLKRLRGELKAQVRLAHQHGRVEDAVAAARMLEIVNGEFSVRQERQQEEVAEATVGR